MPSKKTLAEAYWQYTKQREEKAMDRAREALHTSLYKNDVEYYYDETNKHLRRAERLGHLSIKIVGRMF